MLFMGVRRQTIRKNLVEAGNIEAIIGLPANIFFGTGIPTIVMVLRKNPEHDGILIIDASKGFVKEGKNNKLRACDIKRIVDAVEKRTDIEGFCHVASIEEVRANDYNLNIPGMWTRRVSPRAGISTQLCLAACRRVRLPSLMPTGRRFLVCARPCSWTTAHPTCAWPSMT